MKKELQDRAVSNERDYFDDRVAKGKINLAAVIDWIKPPFQNQSNPFTAFSQGNIRLEIISH
jgi:hypothetical protein